MLFNTVYPDGLFSGLSKIGGVIVLFNIGLILSFYHQYLFDKSLANDLEEGNGKDVLEDSESLVNL